MRAATAWPRCSQIGRSPIGSTRGLTTWPWHYRLGQQMVRSDLGARGDVHLDTESGFPEVVDHSAYGLGESAEGSGGSR